MDDAETLRTELNDLRRRIDQSYVDLLGGWQIGVGPVRLRARMHSGAITAVYVLFHAAVFTCGIIFTFLGDPWSALGVALIVGALFAFGSFVSTFWAIQVGNERQISDLIWREAAAADVASLVRQHRLKRALGPA